jgi:hypothetical protein
MANNCGDCEDDKYTPESVCCPDTAESGVSVDVRDRNCKVKRVRGAKGLFGAIKGKVVQFLDGSSSQPIELSLETVLSSNGYVVIQTVDGRVLALNPNGSSVPLQLVYDSGVLKFVPFTTSKNYIDSELVSSNSMVLAGFSCLADGNVQLGKFLPNCTGNRHLVISEDGKVTCDTVEVGACRSVTAVDDLDSVWGCKDGVFSPLLPVEGKVLIGTGAAPDTKWALGESGSGIKLINPRVQLASGTYSGINNGIMHTSNISWAIQPEYLATHRYVIVRAIAQLGSRGMDTIGELRMDGQNMVSVKVREHPTLTCDHDTDTNQQILAIPGSKVSLLEFVLTDLGNSQANALNDAAFNFYLEGWVS